MKQRGYAISPRTNAFKLANACDPDLRNLVRGALLTGCRYSELARLRTKLTFPFGRVG
jgi:integrase